MYKLRLSTPPYRDVLERILDRGIVLDGLSSLAALSSVRRQPLRAVALCSLDDLEPKIPSAVLCPPRKRQRDS